MLKTSIAIALAAATIALATPASANRISLGTAQGWDFYGNTNSGFCMASTYYEDGSTIHLGLGDAGYSMSFSSPKSRNLFIGDEYSIDVRASNGSSGRLWGTAVAKDQIVIDGLTLETVYNFAKTKRIRIDLFGTFSMRGSYNAIKRVTECRSAISR